MTIGRPYHLVGILKSNYSTSTANLDAHLKIVFWLTIYIGGTTRRLNQQSKNSVQQLDYMPSQLCRTFCEYKRGIKVLSKIPTENHKDSK